MPPDYGTTTAGQPDVDPRGNVVMSCQAVTATRLPRQAVATVVPSVQIWFLPRPHWSARKLSELLEKMQTYPSLSGVR